MCVFDLCAKNIKPWILNSHEEGLSIKNGTYKLAAFLLAFCFAGKEQKHSLRSGWNDRG